MPAPRYYTVGELTLSVSQWARRLGLTRQAMHKRFAKMSPEEAVAYRPGEIPEASRRQRGCSKPGPPGQLYEYDDGWFTIPELAERFGLTETAVRWRIKKYGSAKPELSSRGRKKGGWKRE